MNKKENCCCFTGHRIINTEHIKTISQNLSAAISSLAAEGVTDFITGGALGFDTLAAEAVLRARGENPSIRLVLALPCKGQSDSWSIADRARYNEIKAAADEVIYVSEEYTPICMHKRNRFMCDKSEYCIFYMSVPRGGTAYTVKYALEHDLQMLNIMST